MQVSFYIREDVISKSTGKSPIYVCIICNKERIRKSIKHSCLIKDFDPNKQKVKTSDKNSAIINAKIIEISKKFNDFANECYLKAKTIDTQDINNILVKLSLAIEVKSENDNAPTTIVAALNLYQKLNEKIKSKNTLRIYQQVKGHLETYKKGAKLIEADYKFWLKFIQYLYEDANLEQNTVACIIKKIKTSQKFIIEVGYGFPNDIQKVKCQTVDTEVIYLTEQEIKSIENVVIPDKKEYLRRTRDMFLFQCYTGLRHSDMINLKAENYKKQIQNNIESHSISFSVVKTKKTSYIPLNKKAVVLVNKYINQTDLLFPIISQQNYNVYIKELCKLAMINEVIVCVWWQGDERFQESYKKYQLVSSHTGRHSFATIFLLRGGDIVTLSKLLGHSSINTTMKYPKILETSMNEKIQDIMNF